MQIGMIGLGKMGINLVENMLRNEIEVSAFDISENARNQAQKI
ncbi:NAD(P)-binding domain-containing protein, partial [Globicatella sulfidifaciens]